MDPPTENKKENNQNIVHYKDHIQSTLVAYCTLVHVGKERHMLSFLNIVKRKTGQAMVDLAMESS